MKKLILLSFFAASCHSMAAPSGLGGTPLSAVPGLTSANVTNLTGFSLVDSNSVSAGTNWPQISVAASTGLPLDIMTKFFQLKPARFYNTYWDVRNNATNANTARLQSVVDVWKTNGMLAAGYSGIWVDDDWAATNRAADGSVIADSLLYSGGTSGFSNVCYYAHTNGFWFGAYVACSGDRTTSGRAVGTGYYPSWQIFMLDARYLIASIGIDAVKFDNTTDFSIINPYVNRNSGGVMQLRQWVDAFQQQGKAVRTLATSWPYSVGWKGYTPTGNGAPASFLNGEWLIGSLQNSQGYPNNNTTVRGWLEIMTNVIPNASAVQHPGCSIQGTDIPVNLLTTNVLKAALITTYMMSSDSQISSAYPTANSLFFLTNVDAMAIGDDPLWIPSTNLITTNLSSLFTFPMQGWLKPLGKYPNQNSNGVALYNLSSTNYTFTISATNMGFPANAVFTVHDCFGGATPGTGADIADYTNFFTYTLSTSNTALLRVTQKQFRTGTEILQGSIQPDALLGFKYVAGTFSETIVSNIFDIRGAGGTATLRLRARDADASGLIVYQTANITHFQDLSLGNDWLTVAANATPHDATFQYAVMSKIKTAAKTSNAYTVLNTEYGTWFNNNGNAGASTNSLPAATAGLHYGMNIDAAQNFAFKANGTDTIRNAATVSAAGGLVFSSTIGGTVHITCHVAGKWVVDQLIGTWTVQ